LQVKGEAQTVGPEYPVPPHWPNCVWLGPDAVVVVVVVVEDVDEVLIEVVVLVDELDFVVVVVTVPFPMLVVMGPLSIYTPLKYQSSGVPPLIRRRTPRCQSSELVDVEAAMFCTTLTNGLAPVLAQSPTVPAEKSISYAKLNQVLGSKGASQ